VKYLVHVGIVGAITFGTLYVRNFFVFCVGLILIFGGIEIFRLRKIAALPNVRYLLIFLIFGIYAIGLFAFAWFESAHFVVFTFLTLTSFDGFSQVSGQLFGRRHIFKVSPNKTLEGTLGGAVLATGIAVLLRSLVDLSVGTAVIYGIFISLCALWGDIQASLVKRMSGVKDFSRMIPGHGGFLDRFDSLIFTASAIAYLKFLT